MILSRMLLSYSSLIPVVIATEDSTSQRSLENDFSDRAPLKSTEWDSDWDSDFSLHVKPLSDLSASSSDESQWEPRNQTRPANNESRVRKRSDKTVTNAARRKESKPGTTEQRKGSEIERTLEGRTRRSIGGEDYPRERRDKRPTVKPIPKIGQGIFFKYTIFPSCSNRSPFLLVMSGKGQCH